MYPASTAALEAPIAAFNLSAILFNKEKFSAEAWAKKMGFFYNLSLNKYFFDENYNRFLYQPFLKLSRAVAYVDWDLYDKYFINGFGHVTKILSNITGRMDYEGLDQTLVDGVGRTTQGFGEKLKQVQTGRLQNYMLFALIGVILILVFQAV